MTDEVASYLNAWGDLLAVLIEHRTADVTQQASAAADRMAQIVVDGQSALAGDLAGIREGAATSQRDLSRVGRELVRTGATLEALQSAVAALRPALEQLPERVDAALARDLARDLARERQLREAAERAALDDIIAALDGLELNLDAGHQLQRPGASWEPGQSWEPGLLLRGWHMVGKLIGAPRRPPIVSEHPAIVLDASAIDPAREPLAGINGLLEGLQVTYRRLQDALARRGVTVIEATGTPFDPHLHEAVAVEPCPPDQDGLVVREQRRGYRSAGGVVRLAEVVVGRAGS